MNSQLTFRSLATITISFLLALLLSIAPLPDWLILLWPQWLALVIIYWVIVLPNKISLGITWLLGILLDALLGSTLGEHALALIIIAFFAQKFQHQMRVFPTFQQAIFVLLLVLIYQALLLWIQGILGQPIESHWFWLSAFTSMLFWPWISILLRAGHRRNAMD